MARHRCSRKAAQTLKWCRGYAQNCARTGRIRPKRCTKATRASMRRALRKGIITKTQYKREIKRGCR